MQGRDDIQSTGEVVIGGTFQTTMTNADAALTRVFGSLELTATAGTADTTPPSIGLSASATSGTREICGVQFGVQLSATKESLALVSRRGLNRRCLCRRRIASLLSLSGTSVNDAECVDVTHRRETVD